MKISNLSQVATVLHDYIPKFQSVNWSFALDDMKALMNELGNPQEKVKIIHVAGTSGKTSTCYYISDMLQRTGKTVGLTVSPHVDNINERVQLDGQPLPEAEFCRLFGEFVDLPAVKNNKPSYFGLLVAFAYWVFASQAVDYAVVEVGLGGRLDATNIIKNPNKIAVITDIGLDHTAMLGHDVVTIAGEKAGIIQAGNLVVMNRQGQPVLDAVKRRADKVGASLGVMEVVKAPKQLPLFQQRNWCLARAAVELLAERDSFLFTDSQAKASAQTIIPARMEIKSIGNKTLIFDGAHNNQKILALCKSVKEKYTDQKIAAIVSFSHDKNDNLDEKMLALHAAIDHLIITTFQVEQDLPRWSIDSELVKSSAIKAGIKSLEVVPEPVKALAVLRDRPETVLLITGSFYLLNLIRPLIKEFK
ncbi:MAG: Mur ligase family protein [Candidatus Saccharibacteria bacterium]